MKYKCVRRRLHRTLCAGILSLAMVLSLTAYAEETPPEDPGTTVQSDTEGTEDGAAEASAQVNPDLQIPSEVTEEGETQTSSAAVPEGETQTPSAVVPEEEDPTEDLPEEEEVVVLTISETDVRIPPGLAGCESNFGNDFKLTFQDSDDWLLAVSKVVVAGEEYTKGTSSFSVWANTCYYAGDDYSGGHYLLVGEGGSFVNGKAICVISAEGYRDLTLELDKNRHSAAVIEAEPEPTPEPEPVPDIPDPEQKPAPEVTADTSDSWYIQLAVNDPDYVSGVTGVSINDRACEKQEFKMALNGDQYYLDMEQGRMVFDAWNPPFRSGDILTVTNPGYEDLRVKVTIAGSAVTVTPADDDTQQGDEYTLHIRLSGSFEAALVDQKGYDAVSGASTNLTQNKNSSVSVEAALTAKDTDLAESDWKLLKDSGVIVDAGRTVVHLDASSGMAGVYSPYDSSLTLAGIPQTPGTYPVSVTVTDDQGRTATSNELIFKVYSGEENLEDQLTLDDCVQTADGKYMYDMEPWAIKNFRSEDPQTVTVPADIKAWYGSHESGTYGELGYAVPFGSTAVQTLLIPAGCDLTLVNMNLLSSVRVIVQDGARLTLRDTPVQGVVEVQKGGVFSMNYDGYEDQFLMGAAINGQLILQDGSVVDNAVIYSNTNYIANGTEARRNENPVVVVNGNVTMQGQVIIRGDEASAGGTGQPGLNVKNGSVTVPEGSILAVYGGGYSALTKNGGDAVSLNDGAITGGGTFIAVGGYSADVFGGSTGGNAVSGTGVISVSNTYLQGGNVYKGTAGALLTEDIVLSGGTNRSLTDGKTGPFDYDQDTYWHGATVGSLPDLRGGYPIEENAPGIEEPEPEKPDVPKPEKPEPTEPEKTEPTEPEKPEPGKPDVPELEKPEPTEPEKPNVPEPEDPKEEGGNNQTPGNGSDGNTSFGSSGNSHKGSSDRGSSSGGNASAITEAAPTAAVLTMDSAVPAVSSAASADYVLSDVQNVSDLTEDAEAESDFILRKEPVDREEPKSEEEKDPVSISDEEVPLAEAGRSFGNWWIWTVLVLLAAGAAMLLLAYRKKAE